MLPLLRRLVEGKNGLHRTGRHAGTAVDALVGTNVDTCGVLRADARFSNDVRHADVLETLESRLATEEYNSAPGHERVESEGGHGRDRGRGGRAGLHRSAFGPAAAGRPF